MIVLLREQGVLDHRQQWLEHSRRRPRGARRTLLPPPFQPSPTLTSPPLSSPLLRLPDPLLLLLAISLRLLAISLRLLVPLLRLPLPPGSLQLLSPHTRDYATRGLFQLRTPCGTTFGSESGIFSPLLSCHIGRRPVAVPVGRLHHDQSQSVLGHIPQQRDRVIERHILEIDAVGVEDPLIVTQASGPAVTRFRYVQGVSLAGHYVRANVKPPFSLCVSTQPYQPHSPNDGRIGLVVFQHRLLLPPHRQPHVLLALPAALARLPLAPCPLDRCRRASHVLFV
jgi:hypothetical protein